MSPLDRREFLRQSALVGGAAAAASALPFNLFESTEARNRLGFGGASILDVGPKDAPIDTIVVLMMENRSFDHYLGWLAHDYGYLENGRRRYGRRFRVGGDLEQRFLDPDGETHETYYLPAKSGETNPYRGCHHPDPGHGWDDGRAQRDGGFLSKGSGNDDFALGYYLSDDIPFYSDLARRFTAFDRYHCSVLGPTFPNREYLHAGQSGGVKDNSLPLDTFGFQYETIWDRLAEAQVPAGYYFVDLPVVALWGPRLLPYARHIENYFADCAAGTLPNVTFLDPGFTTGLRTDDHPYADIRAGQKLVFDYFKAFADSSHWERGVFIITYDEWGGFFDHVKPPHLPDDRADQKDEDDFSQAGFRVPTLMASPFSRPGFMDHTLYDHTSILRLIEWRFLGAPARGPGKKGDDWFLTKRDRFANNIGASLLPKMFSPDVHLEALPEVPITSAPCEGEELEGLPNPGDQPGPYLESHAFEKALDAGYFERVGYDIDLKPIPTF